MSIAPAANPETIQTLDSSSSSTTSHGSNYDVFLSFRGPDTRRTFTDHLYTALLQNGIRTFRDEEELEIGEPIRPNLMKFIQQSRISIPIISPYYASSRSCLDELAKAMECKQTIGQIVLPIFFHVDPGDVKKQFGSFAEAFSGHEKRFKMETVVEWRNALREVGRLKGWDLKNVENGHESRLIQLVVKKVLSVLNNTHMDVAKYPIGINFRVEDMMRLLDVGSQDVRFVGVHGMGGLGKTTIAKAVFNQIHKSFDGNSFIQDVRETSQAKGLVYLQNKLVCDILKQGNNLISDVDLGKNMIKERICAKKVLVILDDVDKAVQLDALVGKPDWFGSGSRIIITTRDKHVLNVHGVGEDKIYQPEVLDNNQSLCLLSRNAFGRDQPLEDYVELSKKVALAAGGLPLALEVLGSFLFDKRRPVEWEDTLKKLKRFPLEEIQEKLKISYDGLDDELKDMFLDIACLLIGIDKEKAIKIWEGCDFSPILGIEVLVQKSLVKISDDNELMMHDHLRDMGRAIVRQQSPKDLGKRCRLWSHEEVLDVLKKRKGTGKIEGLLLRFEEREETEPKDVLNTEAFAPMSNLRLLQVDTAHLVGKFEHLPPDLRWLSLEGCSMEFTLSNFHLEKIAVLDLSWTNITHLGIDWHQNKVAENLKVLNLGNCYYLTRTPDFSGFPNLESLILIMCVELVELHRSIRHLNKLVLLNLRYCINLEELPRSICNLSSLESLDLFGCSKLNKLPEKLGTMKSLTDLFLGETAIKQLPDSIGLLKNLIRLHLYGCGSLRRLPDSLGKLESLRELELDETAIGEIPVCIGSLKKLETLTARRCILLTILPNSIGGLESLLDLKLDETPILELPDSVGSLLKLRYLSLRSCESLRELPDSLGKIKSLIELDLDRTLIKEIPDFHGSQNKLEKLEIRHCKLLSRLPDSISSSMRNLTSLVIVGSIITELPDAVGSLEKLERIELFGCKKLVKLPDSMGKLRLLKYFFVSETSIVELPIDFGMLLSLYHLEIVSCQEFKCFPENFGSLAQLKFLRIQYNSKLTVLPISFSRLSSLQELNASHSNLSGTGAIPDDFGELSSLKILELGYNNFRSLPTSISGTSLLENLSLRYCTELESLPALPTSLIRLDATNCISIERLPDLSNLKSLKELILVNCDELSEIQGLDRLESLERLYMSGCITFANTLKESLVQGVFEGLRCFGFPGCEIPSWFTHQKILSGEVPIFRNSDGEIEGMILCIVFALDQDMERELHQQDAVTTIPAIQFEIWRDHKRWAPFALHIEGIPKVHQDQIYLRYLRKDFDWFIDHLKDGDQIRFSIISPPGLHVKKGGMHVVHKLKEGSDDDEIEIAMEEGSQQSVSIAEMLSEFFTSSACSCGADGGKATSVWGVNSKEGCDDEDQGLYWIEYNPFLLAYWRKIVNKMKTVFYHIFSWVRK